MKRFAFFIISLILIISVVSANLPNTSVKLYLPMNGTFIDQSQYGHTVINNGAAFNTTTPIKGNASAYFTISTTQNINLGGSDDFAFNVSDFSIEGGFNLTGTNSAMIIYDSRPSGVQCICPTIYISSTRKLGYSVNNVDIITGGTTVTTNTTHYFKLSKISNVTTLWLDGTLQGTPYSDTNNYLNGNNRPMIGNRGFGETTTTVFPGEIDDIVIRSGNGKIFNGSIVPDREFISNPTAGFTPNITGGRAPLAVALTNTSLGNVGITTYRYIVTNSSSTGGNGTQFVVSTSPSPTIILGIGNWTISQEAVNVFGVSNSTITWVNVTSSIMAQFTPSGPQSIRWPNGISFKDASTGFPTYWDWNWGDGTHCYKQNCFKQWYGPGTYRVNLTVNSTPSDYSSNTTYVTVLRGLK